MTYIIGRYSMITEDEFRAAGDITRDYLRLLSEYKKAPPMSKPKMEERLSELRNRQKLILGDNEPWEKLVL